MNAPDGVSIAAYTGSELIWGRLSIMDMGIVLAMLHAARLATDGHDKSWFEYLYSTLSAMREQQREKAEVAA